MRVIQRGEERRRRRTCGGGNCGRGGRPGWRMTMGQ